MSAQISPAATSKLRSARATMPPNSTRTLSVDNKATLHPPHGRRQPSGIPSARRDFRADSVPPRALHAEEVVETDGEPRGFADPAHGEQCTGHERRTIVRVVADRQTLPGRAEQH